MSKRNCILTVLLLCVSFLPILAHAQISNASNRSLFSDRRAFSEGDIVTVLLMESTQGSNTTDTRTGTDMRLVADNASSGAMENWGLRGFGLGTELRNDNEATGTTSSSGNLQGTITATVTELQDNGLLRIEGERTINVNGESQTVSLTGLVRPEDITSNNTIYSYLVADAEISYEGTGMVSSAGKPGILVRLWNWIF